MLGSSFSEGRSSLERGPALRTIRIEESEESVHMLLELLYVGSLPPEDSASEGEVGDRTSSTDHLLDVFKMCHRWQLASLSDVVEIRLAQSAAPQNIENLLEAALLFGASTLRRACIDKAKDCEVLMSKLRARQLRPSVQSELQRSLGIDMPAAKKRRTLSSL